MFALGLAFSALAQPNGYKLLYSQDFEKAKIKEFEFTDAASWRISNLGTNNVLELFDKSNYQPDVRSPLNIGIIKNKLFGSFVLEADLMQTGREYGHRDLCVFFGMKDPANFYYVHLASKADPNAHNIFLVNDEPRKNIAEKTTEGIDWGDTRWHKVKIVRDVTSGKIEVYFNDMEKPIMEAVSTHFKYGHIGFGSFDDTGVFDNIKIWGTDFAPSRKGFFK